MPRKVTKSKREQSLPEDQKKLLFSIPQLATAYNIHVNTVRKKIGNTPTSGKVGKSVLYHLKDVTELIDVREPYIPPNKKPEPDPEPYVYKDVEHMSPLEKIDHFKGEDLRQSAIAKERKNMTEAGLLMESHVVERIAAEAFKKVALTLDTLPDLLERDGIIDSSSITKVIHVLDNSREQLAADLAEISELTSIINEQGDW